MTNTFKRLASRGITSITSVGGYVVPADTQAIVIGLTVSNNTAGLIEADLDIFNVSVVSNIVLGAPISPGGSLIIDVKIVMETGDSIRVTSTGSTDALMSVLEIS